MKVLFLSVAICFFGVAHAQPTCEQREDKLILANKNFTAALLYNTYGMIGSISDGYEHEAYNEKAVNDLLNAQKQLMESLVQLITEMKTGSYFKTPKDETYLNSVADILLGLKKQAELMQDYIKNKTNKKRAVFEEQRNKNWKDISELMGVK